MMPLMLILLIGSTEAPTKSGSPLYLEPWSCDLSGLPKIKRTESNGVLITDELNLELPKGTKIFHPDTAKKFNTCLAVAERYHLKANARIDATRQAHLDGIAAALPSEPVLHGRSFGWGVGTGVVLTLGAAIALGLVVR